ncbi:MAG: DUF423 domain-containing protein [Planctomycetaceae bacterium]|nr:DUF423 domain-containing protein [Planctomycetaceae bacterium]MCB9953848.1 DUF423 domain-containing protein [Planctomycetaceae bacterium]
MSQTTSPGKCWMLTGAILCGLSVVTGAFAAHGLGPRMEELYSEVTKEVAGEKIPGPLKYLGDFKTAAEYQMTHGLALLAVGLYSRYRRSTCMRVAGWSFLLGTILFSGSLYVLVLTGLTKLGAITPIGGVLFLVGWATFAWAIFTTSSTGCGLDENDSPREY